MQTIYEVSGSIKTLVILQEDLIRAIADLPKTDHVIESLLRELVTLNISAAKYVLIGATKYLENPNVVNENILRLLVGSTKEILSILNQSNTR